MYALLSATNLRNSLHYKTFCKEVLQNKKEYKVNTMGCMFSFRINSLEDCIQLFDKLHSKTGLFVTQYRISKNPCVTDEYVVY